MTNLKSLQLHRMTYLVLLLVSHATPVTAQDSTAQPETSSGTLAKSQEQLAGKFKRLEMLMLKMAELDATENPQRSSLLKKAIAQSKSRFIKKNMEGLVQVLQKEQYRNAITGQSGVRKELKLLLELLENENRTDRIKSEQDRVRQYIRELKRIIRQHKSVQGSTESGEDTSRLSDVQLKVAERAGRLAKEITENEAPPNNESESNDASDREDASAPEGDQKDGSNLEDSKQDLEDADQEQSGDQKEGNPDKKDETRSTSEPETSDVESSQSKNPKTDNDGNREPGNPSEKNSNSEENRSSDGTPREGGKQSQNGKQPQQGQQSKGDQPSEGGGEQQDGEPSGNDGQSESEDQQQQQQQESTFPGKNRIAEAKEKMKEASKKLEDAKRDGAIADQEDARRLLELAQAELEEILRQLREEEVERTLTQLEARFRKMLAMQIAVFDDTTRLAKIPAAKRNKSFDIQSNKTSLAQRRIVDEADRAILLLVEEGSSVAFPEATEQMRGDMDQIAQLLSKAEVTELTLGLEEDVIASLEEMIAALQQAQKDAEERKQEQKQQQQKGQQAGEQEQPLVNAIEELKMIRALQMRVNKRTDLYGKMIADAEDPIGQATDPNVIESLERLAERESRIQKITNDIVSGKTQ